MKMFAITFLVFAVPLVGISAPPIAPPVDDRIAGVENRAESPEGKTNCPCPVGDDCVCKSANCTCQPATENVFNGEGREVVVLGTSWCQYCPAAKSAAEANGVPYFDAETTDKGRELAKRHGVKSYPRILVFQDGDYQYAITQADWPSAIRREAGNASPVKSSPAIRTVSHNDGDASDDQIRQHLVDAHGYTWSQVSGMKRSQLKAAHDRGHGGPARVSLNYPVRRVQPRVIFQQSNTYCPSCRR